MKGGLRTGVNIAARNYPGGQTGIKNLGNTCFLNVVLQSLSSLGSFHLYLDSGAPPTTTPLAKALRESMQALSRSGSSPYDPTPMVTGVPVLQSTFAHGQHDPEELLHHLMTILDAEKGSASKPCADKEEARASSTTTHSSIEKEWGNVGRRNRRTGFDENPFAGRLVSKITCKRCNEERSQKHDFIDLSLSIPSGIRSPSLTNCLSLFTQTEELTGVRCDRCIADRRQYRQHLTDTLGPDKKQTRFQSSSMRQLGLTIKSADVINVGLLGVDKWPTTIANVLRAEKKLSIAKSPRALCLHIQRLVAHPGFRDTMFVKRDDKVRFEPILDLSPFCEQSEIKYSLAAVIVHHGSEDGGHFTVYRRKLVPTENYAQLLQCAASTSISSTDWVHISDEICQRVSEEKVLNAPAYMLFYEKRDVCQ